MDNFGPRVVVNIITGLLLAGSCVALNLPSSAFAPAAEAVIGPSWLIAAAYLLSYAFPSLRIWIVNPLRSVLVQMGWKWFQSRGAVGNKIEHAKRQIPRGFWPYINKIWRRLHKLPSIPYVLIIAAIGVGAMIVEASAELTSTQIEQMLFCGPVPAFLCVAPLAIISIRHRLWRSKWVRETLRTGSGDNAEFATRNDYHPLVVKVPKKDRNGNRDWLDCFIIGVTRFRHDVIPRLVAIKTNVHMLTVGMMGSGKSATVGFVNLLLYAGAVFAVDLKGELAMVCARRRKERGNCYVLDHNNIAVEKTDRWNGLEDCDPYSSEGLAFIGEMSKALVIDETGSPISEHFSKTVQMIMDGLQCYVCIKYKEDGAKRNYVTCYQLMQSIDPATGQFDPDCFDEFVADMAATPHNKCGIAAKLLSDAADREGGSMKTTAAKSLEWMAFPEIQYVLSPPPGEGFSMRELGTHGNNPPSVFVVVGVRKEKPLERYIRMTTMAAMWSVRQEFIKNGGKPRNNVLMYLDEFPKYCRGIDWGFGTAREIGLTLWCLAQKPKQLAKELKEEFDVLKQNANVQVFAPNDVDDAGKWMSDQLGKHVVVRRKGIGLFAKVLDRKTVPLMTPNQVQEACPQKGTGQLVKPVNGRIMWLDRVAYKAFAVDGVQIWDSIDIDDLADENRV